MRRAHAVDESVPRRRRACSNCRDIKSRCEGGPPCAEYLHRGISCSFHIPGKINRRGCRDRPKPALPPSETQKNRFFYIGLYFERFHPYWPFVHRRSFNQYYETPLLVHSMMVIGLWADGGQSAQSAAIDLHNVLGPAIYQQRVSWYHLTDITCLFTDHEDAGGMRRLCRRKRM